jgi:hypothetical protein
VRGDLVVTVAVAVFLVLLESALPFERQVPPGSVAAFAVLGCVGIVVVSKWLGKIGLQRPEPPDE